MLSNLFLYFMILGDCLHVIAEKKQGRKKRILEKTKAAKAAQHGGDLLLL